LGEAITRCYVQTSLPEKFRAYNPDGETAESSHRTFTTTFPRGFALEILHVYSGPPVIVYKFRHWGYVEGPFKGHAPTGERVELYGMAIFEVTLQQYLSRSSCCMLPCLCCVKHVELVLVNLYLSYLP
jgi:hypothetical protein